MYWRLPEGGFTLMVLRGFNIWGFREDILNAGCINERNRIDIMLIGGKGFILWSYKVKLDLSNTENVLIVL